MLHISVKFFAPVEAFQTVTPLVAAQQVASVSSLVVDQHAAAMLFDVVICTIGGGCTLSLERLQAAAP